MRGIVPSLNTPFHEDGTVDHVSLRRLITHTIDTGCDGMLGLAVAGEHSTLSLEEKAWFIDTVTTVNAQRIPFIVSVTSPDTDASIRLAQVAKAAGAAGICVQLPAGSDRREMLGFLQDLAGHAPEMLMVQDLDWSGGGLALDDIVYLYEHVRNFSWLKIETQRAGPKYSTVMSATQGGLNVCGGWAVTQLMDAMARGVTAFIPTGMERVYVEIHRLHENGDAAAARTLFERLLPVLNFSNQHIDTSIRFFKELRKAEGLFDTSVCRTTSATFDDIQEREAAHALSLALVLMAEFSGRAD